MTDLEQLNREIAERVMGWVVKDYDGELIAYTGGTRKAIVLHPKRWTGSGWSKQCELWSPATDIAAAFEVADKLVRFQLSRCDCGGPWSCRSAFFDAVEAETAPMAICLAALRSKCIEWKPAAETP